MCHSAMEAGLTLGRTGRGHDPDSTLGIPDPPTGGTHRLCDNDKSGIALEKSLRHSMMRWSVQMLYLINATSIGSFSFVLR